MKKILLSFVLFTICITLLAQPKNKTRNIILVTIDGLRWQEVFSGADSSFISNNQLVRKTDKYLQKYWYDTTDERRKLLMPFLWETVATQGQIYGNRTKGCFVNVKNSYWFSYPGYNEILTGFADERINSNGYGPNPNISILEYLNQLPAFKNRIAVFASWNAFNDILNEKRSDLLVNSGFENTASKSNEKLELLNSMQTTLPDIFEGVRLDAVTFQMGFEYLKTEKPKVLFLSFDETDDFAHAGRYSDYLNSTCYTDGFLSELWKWVQKDPDYKDQTTLFITCDHGRGEDPDGWKSHGTKTPNSDQTWFAVIGPDTPALGEITEGQFYNNQFAKTMASLLEVNFQSKNKIGNAIEQVLGK